MIVADLRRHRAVRELGTQEEAPMKIGVAKGICPKLRMAAMALAAVLVFTTLPAPMIVVVSDGYAFEDDGVCADEHALPMMIFFAPIDGSVCPDDR